MNPSGNEKEKWIESVMRSVAGITPPEPNPFLHQRVLARLARRGNNMPVRWAWICAFAIAVIIGLNAAAVKEVRLAPSTDPASAVIAEYGLAVEPGDNDLVNHLRP
ncbi:MAG TPA: hypothetical protein VEB86_14800 [Chryseosolibacter sp.]|nr:hypothetical protein [Chryseosolibacter sp.]